MMKPVRSSRTIWSIIPNRPTLASMTARSCAFGFDGSGVRWSSGRYSVRRGAGSLIGASVDRLGAVGTPARVLPVPVPRPGAFRQVRERGPEREQSLPQPPVLAICVRPRLRARLREAADGDEPRRAHARRHGDDVVRLECFRVDLLPDSRSAVPAQRVRLILDSYP